MLSVAFTVTLLAHAALPGIAVTLIAVIKPAIRRSFFMAMILLYS
jgi:hypothetical protein